MYMFIAKRAVFFMFEKNTAVLGNNCGRTRQDIEMRIFAFALCVLLLNIYKEQQCVRGLY